MQITGTANVKQAQTQFAALQSQVSALNEELRETAVAAAGVNASGFDEMNKKIAANSKVWRSSAASTGMWHTEQIRVTAATDSYTEALERQKLSMRDLWKQQKIGSAAYREQLKLQNMVVRSQPGRIKGKQTIDIAVPTEVTKDLDNIGNRIGWIREQTRSAAHQMVNWGKNTQWAGRQLMVGFTMPVAAFGAATGALAYQVDKQMTRIAKVYDTTANANNASLQGQMQMETELSRVRQDAMVTAENAARQYGASATDTLDVQAELAATGAKGAELQASTAEVMRISALGELDYQTATKATIALQSVFRMSNEELTESFNYMNSVENATSLATADFAAAIPIAAAPVKAFGGDIQELGILLTAMKERGIEATQGANAIKAAMQRLGRPSKQVQEEWTALTGTDITKIFDDSDNLIDLFTRIREATSGLDNKEQIKAFSGLFGTYQVTRMSALVEGMGDLETGVGQVSSAMDIAGQDTTAWAATADREVKRMQESVSGQFKIAVETIKVELAQMGEPFLLIATKVIGAVTKIISAFNSMPDSAKTIIAAGAIFMALVGPIIMLTGLFANFTGNILTFGVAITGVLTKFKLLNTESAAARIASNLASAGFATEATSAQALAVALEKLALAETAAAQATMGRTQAAAQANLAAGAGAAATPAVVRNPNYGKATESGATDRNYYVPSIPEKTVKASADLEEQSEKTSKNWKRGAGALGVGGAALGFMAISSEGIGHDFANMALYAAMIGPLLVGVPWKSIGTSMATGATKAMDMAKGITLTRSGILGAVGSFAKFVGPAGLIALAIGGLAVMYSKMDDIAEATAAVGNSGDKWAEAFGYTPTEPGQYVDPKTGETVDSLITRVNKLNESVPEVGRTIASVMDKVGGDFSQAAAEAEAMDIAIQQGLEVITNGGTAEQARQAVETSLMAGIGNRSIVDELMAEVDLKVDFKLDGQVFRESLNQIKNQMDQRINNEIGMTKVESILKADYALSEGSEEAGKQAALDFMNQFSSLDGNPEAQFKFAEDMTKYFDSQMDTVIARLRQNPKLPEVMEALGYGADFTDADLIEEFNGDVNEYGGVNQGVIKDMGVDYQGISTQLRSVTQAQTDFAREVARTAGYVDGAENGFDNLDQVVSNLIPGYSEIAYNSEKMETAQADYKVALSEAKTEADRLGVSLDKGQRLAVLNTYRVAAGLEKTGALADGFSEKVSKEWTMDLYRAGGAVDGVNNKLAKTRALAGSIKMDQIGDMARDAMSSFQQGISDATMSNFDRNMSRAMETVERQGENRMDAFEKNAEAASNAMEARQEAASTALENRQEAAQTAMENRHAAATAALERRQEARAAAIERSYDKRIEKIQDAIEAEQKADEIRERLFDAEMKRIDRLAESANRNIDFNVALNEGDLDEAAKIRNDSGAQASQYTLEDASEQGARRSQRRQGKMENSVEAIEKARDAELERIARIEEAERASLERRQAAQMAYLERQQQAQQAALEASQARQQAAMEAQQEAERNQLQNSIDANKRAEENKWNSRRDYLERSLADFTGVTATSTKELQKQVKTWNKEHKGLTLVTEKRFDVSSDNINQYLRKSIMEARNQVANDNAWNSTGQKIASKMIQGAFGLNMGQFKQWMVSGKWPKGGSPPNGGRGNSGGGGGNVRKPGDQTTGLHEGGQVGVDKGSLKGVARTTRGLHPSEQMIRAQKGEFVVNRRDSANNLDTLRAINSGKAVAPAAGRAGMNASRSNKGSGVGGGGAALGFGGIMAASIAAATKTGVDNAARQGGQAAWQRELAARRRAAARAAAGGGFAPGAAGMYGDRFFGIEQLRHAATIASVGSNMGMSTRDLQIGIMTAITESGLVNVKYGDRDSLGLFQQRPSMGWGTPAQVTNPEYASRAFFGPLKALGSRGGMSPWMAAQTIQRSAYSDGSNYQQYWDEAQAIFSRGLKKQKGGGFSANSGGFKQGSGGLHRPSVPGKGWRNSHDYGNGIGSPLYAYNSGVVTSSKATTSGGSPGNGLYRDPISGAGYTSYGENITIRGDDGSTVLYAHLSPGKRFVNAGQRVKGGALIGLSGNTGNSTGPHTHFTTNGTYNAQSFFAGKGIGLKTGGFTMTDGMAMLHEGETVVTKPLTKEFHEGVKNFANGGNNTYNVGVTLNDTQDMKPGDVAREVVKLIKREDARKPQHRSTR